MSKLLFVYVKYCVYYIPENVKDYNKAGFQGVIRRVCMYVYTEWQKVMNMAELYVYFVIDMHGHVFPSHRYRDHQFQVLLKNCEDQMGI